MANDAYDDLFDAWGRALNINPQLGKTVFHIESSGNPNTPDGPLSPNAPTGADGRPETAQGGMQIMPSTARAIAAQLGFDPAAVNLHDMRWAVPIGMAYLAQGMNATQSPEGALSYYHGGPDAALWGPKTREYVARALKLYPTMNLTPAAPAAAQTPAAPQAANQGP